MSTTAQDTVPRIELTRKGFITNYPPYRYWRPETAQRLLDPKPLNIYVHTPYCVQRCAYCHYKTTTLNENRKAEIDRYVQSLCTEIQLASQRFHLKERPTHSIYFGGGTPTLLSKENLSRIMDCLREHLTFAEPEITVEGEPVTLIQAKADHLKHLGVNRISLGIQSLADEIILKTGRRDTEKHAFKAIEIAKGTGAVVNVDLMSGLAGETDETWAYTVERALAADVHSLTVYKTELYANTEYYAGIKKNTLELPSDEEELKYAAYAIEKIEAKGYLPVNFFTFTQGGGHMQRHTTSKWRGDDIYAFGVSAFGSIGSFSVQNISDLEKYSSTLEAGELPIARGYHLNAKDLMARDVVLGMKLIHLDRKAFRQRYGLDLVRLCEPTVNALVEEGFITVSDERLSLTRKGILWGDYTGRQLAAAVDAVAS
ncbi:coproporphyrinogen-III oxidase family protein [Stigmatella sp. ncwal1]|uniref:Coproporphyrinogen-III oxidase family protein n=1 Tax=Stigmatella ashevillensis TaxID=2995309 RepID=A0ABT5DCE7_9BACT|nr:coproporphyrinogen-III oxidase family protein [Stigmatella ashevillena]MDC0711355.1 coproporphyrinogen-III oxidase family protein [Stigmatella ashevillena]